jgi:hypothetical protein
METAREYLKKVGIKDRIINDFDLPEYWKTISGLMEEYANQFKNDCYHQKEDQYISDAGCYCQKCGEEITVKR